MHSPKNTRETAQAIKGTHIQKATEDLKDVTTEAKCATPSIQGWRRWVSPGQRVGLDTGLVAQKEC